MPNALRSFGWSPERALPLRHAHCASLADAVHAGAAAAKMVTRRFRFTGRELVLNDATAAGGSVRAEMQDADGKPLSGFALADARSLNGDAIEQAVA